MFIAAGSTGSDNCALADSSLVALEDAKLGATFDSGSGALTGLLWKHNWVIHRDVPGPAPRTSGSGMKEEDSNAVHLDLRPLE